jgi:hypothetical protein
VLYVRTQYFGKGVVWLTERVVRLTQRVVRLTQRVVRLMKGVVRITAPFIYYHLPQG